MAKLLFNYPRYKALNVAPVGKAFADFAAQAPYAARPAGRAAPAARPLPAAARVSDEHWFEDGGNTQTRVARRARREGGE